MWHHLLQLETSMIIEFKKEKSVKKKKRHKNKDSLNANTFNSHNIIYFSFFLLLIFSILFSPFRRSLHEAEQAGGSRLLVQRVPQGQA